GQIDGEKLVAAFELHDVPGESVGVGGEGGADEEGFAAVVAFEGEAEGGAGEFLAHGGGLGVVDGEEAGDAQGVEVVEGEFDAGFGGACDDGGFEEPAVLVAAQADAGAVAGLEGGGADFEDGDGEDGVGAE